MLKIEMILPLPKVGSLIRAKYLNELFENYGASFSIENDGLEHSVDEININRALIEDFGNSFKERMADRGIPTMNGPAGERHALPHKNRIPYGTKGLLVLQTYSSNNSVTAFIKVLYGEKELWVSAWDVIWDD
jgi:hypothetical protein